MKIETTNLPKYLSKIRDLTLVDLNKTQCLVVACDSDGGIGNKPYDVVRVSEELIGMFAVRVPLFEILACGAIPFLVVDCLSVEMEDTGAKILAAIKEYASRAGLREDIQFTGSTEDNVPTMQTGVGVTVLGIAEKDLFYPGSSVSGDVVVCAGIPKSGPRFKITLDDPEILTIEDLVKLRAHQYVRDILPVGSKGIGYEAEQIAKEAGLQFVKSPSSTIDYYQSAGPSTCVLFTLPYEEVDSLGSLISAPIQVIGHLQEERV